MDHSYQRKVVNAKPLASEILAHLHISELLKLPISYLEKVQHYDIHKSNRRLNLIVSELRGDHADKI